MFEILLAIFFGHTATDWVVQWFHWIMQFPSDESPTLDQTGNLTIKHQPNSSVYMLPGEHSAVAPNRHVTIPSNKPIMMPVFWVLVSTDSESVEESFVNKANTIFADEQPTKLFATLDGKQLAIVSILTPVFRLNNIPHDNAFEMKSGSTFVISKGYWVFMNPLPAGNHTLTYVGATHNYVNGATFYLKIL